MRTHTAFGLSDIVFRVVSLLSLVLALGVLLFLLGQAVVEGGSRLSFEFLTNYPSRFAHKAGILPALLGSIYLMILTAVISFPIGIGAAIYLEEYSTKSLFTKFVELNIANLSAVPSIIYGILGLQLFVRFFHMDRSLIAGACTMALLIMPVVVIASREALRQVPQSLRHAALALGATRWQAIWGQVLPAALPGIMTGCILAFSRALGETAPLVAIGALTYVAYLPDSIFSGFSVLPIQIFNWISRPNEEFHRNGAAAIVVLLTLLLVLNSIAILLRLRYQRRGRL
jgi:phosphate transport system permease protein